MFKRLFKQFRRDRKPKSVTDLADHAAKEPEDVIKEEKIKLSDSIRYLKSCEAFNREKAFHALNYLDDVCSVYDTRRKVRDVL